jgi:hypothetical protein
MARGRRRPFRDESIRARVVDDAKFAKEVAAEVQKLAPPPSPPPNQAPERNVGQKLLGFVERPMFTLPVGILGGIVALLFWPLWIVCGICVILAFHKEGVVKGKRRLVQILSYVLLVAIISGAILGLKKITDNSNLAKQIATLVADDIKPKGFMQFGDAWFATKKLVVGPPLAINLSLMNKGSVPVEDMYVYFEATLTPRGQDPNATDRKTHANFLNGALKAQDEAIRQGKPGQTLGTGESIWGTLTFRPLTIADVNAIMSGEARLYIYVWSRWQDEPHDLDKCLWLQPPPTPDISDFKKLIWHKCSE